jgi:Zn-dependent peptidase ImmA (M78 family)
MLTLQDYLTLPVCNVPDLMGSRDFRTLEDADIEKIAKECRRYWGLGDGPISDIHLLMENHGVIVIHDEVGSATMDGLSAWSTADGRAYIYVAIDKPSAVRSRFNVAHELAHLVLHRHVKQPKLSTPEEFKEIERQAHLFAAAFLLPAETFSSELFSPSLNSFIALKERWKVSVGVMIKRSQSLALVEEDYLVRLWKHYSSRGWKTREPLDDSLPSEQPCLPSRSIMVLAEKGGWTVPQILTEIPFFANDIERLTSLPTGYLNDQLARVFPMPAIKPIKAPHHGEAEVFDFQEFQRRKT